jgi:hypothetical protein
MQPCTGDKKPKIIIKFFIRNEFCLREASKHKLEINIM